jgi:type IV pilus assembly protein PilW
MTHHRFQTGLSLVELMVALAISSFLVLGVTQVYIDNKRSYSFQQNQTENLEGGRYALLLLQQELSKAGYRRRPDEQPDTAFPAVGVLPSLGCDAFAKGVTIQRTALDSLCIRYQPRDHLERNCLGDLPSTATALTTAPYTSSGEIIIERLYFEKDTGSDAGALKCTRVHTVPAGTVISDRTVMTGELVSGLVDLRYELGVGSAADPRNISQYTTAATTLPILAVRYTALMRSSGIRLRESITVDDALENWQGLVGLEDSDSVLAGIKAADSGQLYQVSQSNVMLRNLMP